MDMKVHMCTSDKSEKNNIFNGGFQSEIIKVSDGIKFIKENIPKNQIVKINFGFSRSDDNG